METDSNESELIEKYLMGKIKGEELEKFRDRNESFMEKVRKRKTAMDAIDDHFDHELKIKLRDIEQRERERKKRNASIRKRITWGIAASLIIFLTVTLFITNKKGDPGELFLSYYEPFPDIIRTSERSERIPDNLTLAMRFYSAGDYANAIKLFEKELDEDGDHAEIHFYYALSNLSLTNISQAIQSLEIVVESGHEMLSSPAGWYLGLAYLRNGQISKARTVFLKIKTADNVYSEKAGRILKEL